MAVKRDAKTPVKVKKPQRQKIVVEEGSALSNPPIPYKVLYSEKVESVEKAKERVAQLKLEYPEKSIHYFSV